MLENLLYIATGAVAGFSAGLLGIGGGLIIVPVLYFIFATQSISGGSYEPQHLMHMALATSLATIVVTSISSTLAHHKKQAVIWPIVLILSPGIAVGAWLGASFAAQLDTSTLKPVFGLFELFVAALMFKQYQSKQHHLNIKTTNAIIGGGLIGGISSIVGIGGGTLTVPFLHWHNINIKNAIATSAACGVPIALFASASYIYSGWHLQTGSSSYPTHISYVQLDAFLFISISSFLCAPLGAKLAHKVPDSYLKKTFTLLLLLLGLKMLFL